MTSGQRTTCESWFSLFTMWVLGIEPRFERGSTYFLPKTWVVWWDSGLLAMVRGSFLPPVLQEYLTCFPWEYSVHLPEAWRLEELLKPQTPSLHWGLDSLNGVLFPSLWLPAAFCKLVSPRQKSRFRLRIRAGVCILLPSWWLILWTLLDCQGNEIIFPLPVTDNPNGFWMRVA